MCAIDQQSNEEEQCDFMHYGSISIIHEDDDDDMTQLVAFSLSLPPAQLQLLNIKVDVFFFFVSFL